MSVIYSFLSGCCIGALGHYFWQHYKINNHHAQSVSAKKDEKVTHLFEQYPYLMNLIKSNVNDPEYKTIREFFVVDKLAIMNSSTPRLRYDLSDETLSLLKALEKLEYIQRLEHDSLLYRMTEDFVAHLKSASQGGPMLGQEDRVRSLSLQ